MLRAGVGPHTVAIRAKNAVHRQVHGLAENIPEAIVHGGGVGKLPHRAVPLGSELGQVQDALADERALGGGQPSEVAPVGVAVTVGELIVALDTAGGRDGGKLFGAAEVGAALPGVGLRGLQHVDFDFLDRKTRPQDASARPELRDFSGYYVCSPNSASQNTGRGIYRLVPPPIRGSRINLAVVRTGTHRHV